ncbi:MAG: FHA domain-containing protein [Planctomycetota bacterium]
MTWDDSETLNGITPDQPLNDVHAQLLCVQGGLPPFTIKGDEFRIGRHSENDLRLPSGSASRRHARLVRRGGKYALEDVGSSNGTLLNGRALTSGQPEMLSHNDRIQIAEFVFLFADWGEIARSRNLPSFTIDSAEVKEEADQLIRDYLGIQPGDGSSDSE